MSFAIPTGDHASERSVRSDVPVTAALCVQETGLILCADDAQVLLTRVRPEVAGAGVTCDVVSKGTRVCATWVDANRSTLRLAAHDGSFVIDVDLVGMTKRLQAST